MHISKYALGTKQSHKLASQMADLKLENSRIKELDGLRGMTILAAVIYHYINNLINANASSFNFILKSLTKYLYTSIDMFFLLSGFLVGGILLKNKNSHAFFKTFYIRRIYRIVPLYFLLLVCVLLICNLQIGKGTEWWFDAQIPFWTYFTFFQNIVMGLNNTMGNAWLNPTWSLGVEEQFYISIAFLIYFCPRKLLISILIIGIISAPIFRYYAPTVYALSTFTHCRLDSLFGGILIALFYQENTFILFFQKHLSKLIIAIVVLLGISFLFSIGKFKMEFYVVNSWFSIIYILILILILVDKNNMLSKMVRFKFFVDLGLYSYSIYLFHKVILGLFFFTLLGKLPQLNTAFDFLMILSCALLTFMFSRFIFNYFEKKFISIGHRYKY
jgi:peptidoglycan/LPS O-acetylase OafA/YrhL